MCTHDNMCAIPFPFIGLVLSFIRRAYQQVEEGVKHAIVITHKHKAVGSSSRVEQPSTTMSEVVEWVVIIFQRQWSSQETTQSAKKKISHQEGCLVIICHPFSIGYYCQTKSSLWLGNICVTVLANAGKSKFNFLLSVKAYIWQRNWHKKCSGLDRLSHCSSYGLEIVKHFPHHHACRNVNWSRIWIKKSRIHVKI